MSYPKVSIIVPAYNAEKTIEKSIRSLMEQTFDDLELIIIDDCSNDNTLNIVESVSKEYPQRLSATKIFRVSHNQGVAAARALGINNATGDYTIHMDSDDYCERNMIECLYNEAVKNDADMVICDFYMNYPKKQLYISQKPPEIGKECIPFLLGGGLHSSTSNKLIRRTLYTDNDINFMPSINMWEDMSTIIKLSYFASRVSYLPNAFLYYTRMNPQSYTANIGMDSLKNMKQAVDDIENFLSQKNMDLICKNELISFKLRVKREWLRATKGIEQRASARLYLDTDAYILSDKKNPIYYRYAQWLASKNCFLLTNILLVLIGFGKRLRGKLWGTSVSP